MTRSLSTDAGPHSEEDPDVLDLQQLSVSPQQPQLQQQQHVRPADDGQQRQAGSTVAQVGWEGIERGNGAWRWYQPGAAPVHHAVGT